MIDRIRIRNFKCLSDVDVELGPLNVLIGPNDSGKSSFLDALGLFRTDGGSGAIPIQDSMIWNCDKRFKPSLTVITNGQSHEFLLPFIPDRGYHQPLRELAQKLSASETYRLHPSRLRAPVQTRNEGRLSADGSNLAGVLHALLTAANRKAFFDIEKKFCDEIPALQQILTPLVNDSMYHIEFMLESGAIIPSERASDGAMLLLAFLAIIYGNAPDILMIEEPENGLHPSRLKMVIEFLRKISKGEIDNRPRQVILTTHSPLLLNFVEPGEVRIFRRDKDKGTEVSAMDKIPNIDRLSKEFAPGELWYLYGEEELVKGHAT